LQRVKGLIAAAVIGIPLGAFIFVSLHASREIAVVVGSGVGLAIFAVVATGTDARDAVADAAWRQAAPDLPPASDRIAMETSQATMPGPHNGRRTSPRHREDRQGARPGNAATPGAPSR
jgi:hypothetical protein